MHGAMPAVKTRQLLSSFFAASLAVPAQAFAQPPPPPPPTSPPPVQPVPYSPSQPVPYPGTDAPAAVNVPRAQVGSDVVYLKGGGMIRGTLVEAIPNDHATVELVNGQSAVIPWDRVERIDRGGTTAPPSPYYPTPGAAPPAPHGPVPSATVHIESDSPVSIERREGRAWVYACSAPCDSELPLAPLYRISGTEVRSSSAFHLNARPGDHVVLDVNTASKGSFTGGIVLTGVGGGAMLVGAMVLYVVAVFDVADRASGVSTPSSDGNTNTVGWVMVGAGAAALTVGVILLAGNVHSKVDQSQQNQTPPKPRGDAWLRTPSWHDDKSAGAAGIPKVVGVPLFETRF